jgi:hypothetical protein
MSGTVYYYANKANADSENDSTDSFPATDALDTLPVNNPAWKFWRISTNNHTGSSPDTGLYEPGDNLAADGDYHIYPEFAMYYFSTQADALNNTNVLQTEFGDTNVQSVNGITSWKIAVTADSGTADTSLVYNVASKLNNNGNYYLYPSVICFLEGSKILCNVNSVDTYLPVEELRKGSLVKTKLNGYKAVELICKSTIQNPGNDDRIEDRLYKCSPAKYPDLTEDLYITGAHSILVPTITDEQREQINKFSGRVFVTDRMYRLPAWIDSKSEAWNSEGQYTVWHFALENVLVNTHYGVYANGLLVESCSIHSMKNKANITFV